MKKFFSLLAVMMLTLFSVMADSRDEAQIRQMFAGHNQMMSELNFKGMLRFYAPEYTGSAEDGTVETYNDFKKIAPITDAIEMMKDPQTALKGVYIFYDILSSSPEFFELEKEEAGNMKLLKEFFTPGLPFSKFMQISFTLTGDKPDDATLTEFKKLDNTPEGNAQVTRMQQAVLKDTNLTEIIGDMKKSLKKYVDSFVIRSISVSGNQAVVIYRTTDDSVCSETTSTLVKRNGQWLILKEVNKEVKN